MSLSVVLLLAADLSLLLVFSQYPPIPSQGFFSMTSGKTRPFGSDIEICSLVAHIQDIVAILLLTTATIRTVFYALHFW